MTNIRAGIYIALDHLHFAPDNAVWENIIKDDACVGIRLVNPIVIPKGTQVMAISENHPFRTSYMMVFGKYGCYPFLLKHIGNVKLKEFKL